MIGSDHSWNTSMKPLIWGLVLSFVFTIAAYFLVTYHILSGWPLVFTIFGFCVLSAMAQLIFYMHLFIESKPRWSMMTFLFLVLVIVVVVGGTMWIMNQLDYNVMPGM